MFAAYADRPDVVAALLLFNVNIFHTNYLGQNTFMWAAISGSIPTLRVLFDYIQFTPNLKSSQFGAFFNNISHSNSNPQATKSAPTALSILPTSTTASDDNLPPTYQSLTQPVPLSQYNNDVLSDLFAARCNSGFTVITYACRFRRKATLLFLYYYGSLLTYIDKNGKNILHHACQLDVPHIATWLIQFGLLDLTKQDFDGNTPIHLAVINKHFKLLEHLIKYQHASITFNIPNVRQETPYSLILASKNTKLIHLMDEKAPTGFNMGKFYGFGVQSGGAWLNWFFLTICCNFGITYNLIIQFIRRHVGVVKVLKDGGNRVSGNHSHHTDMMIGAQHQRLKSNHSIHNDDGDANDINNPLVLSSLTQSDAVVSQSYQLQRNGSGNESSTCYSFVNSEHQFVDNHFRQDGYITSIENIVRLNQLSKELQRNNDVMSMDSFTHGDGQQPQLGPTNLSNLQLSVNPLTDLTPVERASLWLSTVTGTPLETNPTVDSIESFFTKLNTHSHINPLNPNNTNSFDPFESQTLASGEGEQSKESPSKVWSIILQKYHYFQNNSPHPASSFSPTSPSPPLTQLLTTSISAAPNMLLPPLFDYLENSSILTPPYQHSISMDTSVVYDDSSSSLQNHHHETDDDTYSGQPDPIYAVFSAKPLYLLRQNVESITNSLDIFNNCFKSFCFDWNDKPTASFWASRYLLGFVTLAIIQLIFVIFPHQWVSLYKEFTAIDPVTAITTSNVPLLSIILLFSKQFILIIISISIIITWCVCHYSDPGVIQAAPARQIRHFNPEKSASNEPNSNSPNCTSKPKYTHYFNHDLLSPVARDDQYVYIYPSKPELVQEIAHLQFSHSLMHPSMSSGIGSTFGAKGRHFILGTNGKKFLKVIGNENDEHDKSGAVVWKKVSKKGKRDTNHFDNIRDDLYHVETNDYGYPPLKSTLLGAGVNIRSHYPHFCSKSLAQSYFIGPYGDRNILHPLPYEYNGYITPEMMNFPLTSQGFTQSSQLFHHASSLPATTTTTTTISSPPTLTPQEIGLSSQQLPFSNGLSFEPGHSTAELLANALPHLLINTRTIDYNVYAPKITPNSTFVSQSVSYNQGTEIDGDGIGFIPFDLVDGVNSSSLYTTFIQPLSYLPQSIYSTTPLHYQQPHFSMPPLSRVCHNPTTVLPTQTDHNTPSAIFLTQPHLSTLSPTLEYSLDNYLIDPFSSINSSRLFSFLFKMWNQTPIHAFFKQDFLLSSINYPQWLNTPLSYEPSTVNYTNTAAMQYLSTVAPHVPELFPTEKSKKGQLFSLKDSQHHSPKFPLSRMNTSLSTLEGSTPIPLSEISFLTAINIAGGAMLDALLQSKDAIYALPAWTTTAIEEATSYVTSKTTQDPDGNRFGPNNDYIGEIDLVRKQHKLTTQKYIQDNFENLLQNELFPFFPQTDFPDELIEFKNNSVSSHHDPNNSPLLVTNTTFKQTITLPTPNDNPFLCGAYFTTLLTSGIVTTPTVDYNISANPQFDLNQPHDVYNTNDIINVNSSTMICLDCRVATPVGSYHCKTCGHCCYWLDHHCPLLATCIGAGNYRSFVLFCALGTIMSLYYLFTLIFWFVATSTEAFNRPGTNKNQFSFFEFVFFDLGKVFSVILLLHAVLFTFFVALLFLSHIVLICGNDTSVTSMERGVVKYQPKVYLSKKRKSNKHSGELDDNDELTNHSSSQGLLFRTVGVIDALKVFFIGRMNIPVEFPVFGQTLSLAKLEKRFSSPKSSQVNKDELRIDDQVAVAVNISGDRGGDVGGSHVNSNKARVYYKQDLLQLDTIAVPNNVNRFRKFVLKLLFLKQFRKQKNGGNN
jgi:ankyrin repeat protein